MPDGNLGASTAGCYHLEGMLFWLITPHHFNSSKFMNCSISPVFRYASPVLFSIFSMLEIWRLYLGYSGNLMNRVPELAGCFLLSCFPQAVICIYFAYLQSIRDFVVPVEIAMNTVYLALILPEIILSYKTAGNLIKSQALNFLLQSDIVIENT
jgi:transmembrane protein 17